MSVKQLTIEEPVWKIATLFPNQGHWSVAEYLALDTNHLVEFSNGTIEVLAMPSIEHQFFVSFLNDVLKRFVMSRKLGRVLFSPTKVLLWEGKIREPDILFISNSKLKERTEHYWLSVDLVMEVVSPDDPSRDLEQRRIEYAVAGIAEYWIVDPRKELVTVLTLAGDVYTEHGIFGRNQTATSVLLEGFTVSVDEIFDSAE